MNIEGKKTLENQALANRDAIGIWNTEHVEIHAQEEGRMLLIEVPMQF
jgi:hypothetical protein